MERDYLLITLFIAFVLIPMSLGLIILLRACREIDDKCDHHSGNGECHNKTGDIENETKLEKDSKGNKDNGKYGIS